MSRVSNQSHTMQSQPQKQECQRKSISIASLRQLFLFIFCISLIQVSAAASCYSSSRNGVYCTLCLNNEKTSVVSCSYNGPIKDCYTTCCGLSYQISIPINCVTPEENGTGLSVGSIVIIVVFSIPVLVCIIMVICSWCSNNRTPAAAQQRGHRPPVSEVNLQLYNLQQCFPYHIDFKQSCSICLQSQCYIMTLCGHPYHSSCLLAWIKKRESCPLCVSTEFNPIAIFCTTCGKCLKMNGMYGNMTPQKIKEWEECVEMRCENCLKDSLQQQIQISLGQDEVQRYQKKVQRKDRNPMDNQGKIKNTQNKAKSIQ